MESIIHDRQRDYYEAINTSNAVGESTVFVAFMLSAIKASLIEAIETSDELRDAPMDQADTCRRAIERYLQTHPYIMNADVHALCGVSAATANRILAGFTGERMLEKYRQAGHWGYRLRLENDR